MIPRSVTITTRASTVRVNGGATVAIKRPDAVKVVIVGIQGPNGATSASFTHTQSIALAIWTVPHNLGRFPSVTVVNNLNQRIEPDVEYIDANTVRITHAAAQIGKVYCN